MKILLSVDAHGEVLEVREKVDMILVAGDFAKGDKLREAVFNGGSREVAKKEIIDSSKKFLKSLSKFNCPIVISLGNAEEWGKKEIVELIKEYGFIYCGDKSVKVKSITILGLNFFVEKWRANKYHQNNKHSNDKAIKDEKRINKILSKNKEADIILSHVPLYGLLDNNPNPPEFIKKWAGPCGSKILKKYIIQAEPKLVVCGHIHIPGEVKLGKTRVINPGPSKIIEI